MVLSICINTCYYNSPSYALCACLRLPSNPTNITVSSLIDGSFAVNWTITDPSYSYTMIWTNLHTSVINSFTAPLNTNYYIIITGLSDNVNYAVSIATVDMCGVIITSDPITICGKNTNSTRGSYMIM